MPDVTLTVDGDPVTVPPGTTILKAAEQAGRHVPLIGAERLRLVGARKLCAASLRNELAFSGEQATERSEGADRLPATRGYPAEWPNSSRLSGETSNRFLPTTDWMPHG